MDSIIDNKLLESIKEYCKLNDLEYGEFINTTLREEFMKKKWGAHQPNQPKPKKEEPNKPLTEKLPTGNIKTPPSVGKQAPPPPPRKPHIPKKRDLYGE